MLSAPPAKAGARGGGLRHLEALGGSCHHLRVWREEAGRCSSKKAREVAQAQVPLQPVKTKDFCGVCPALGLGGPDGPGPATVTHLGSSTGPFLWAMFLKCSHSSNSYRW